MSEQRPVAVTPHLFVRSAERAVDFYVRAFGAVELFRNTLPDGTIGFVELAFGDARVLLSEETRSLKALAPPTVGGSPVMLMIEVTDVDALAQRAVEAGAKVDMPVEEMFWGERYRVLVDPFGHRWAVPPYGKSSPPTTSRRTHPRRSEVRDRRSGLDHLGPV